MIEWQGKKWERAGKCSKCGVCCKYTKVGVCPFLKENLCSIYKVTKNPPKRVKDKFNELGMCDYPESCLAFPEHPGWLTGTNEEIKSKCTYKFNEA